jgi:hypothetical protein
MRVEHELRESAVRARAQGIDADAQQLNVKHDKP